MLYPTELHVLGQAEHAQSDTNSPALKFYHLCADAA